MTRTSPRLHGLRARRDAPAADGIGPRLRAVPPLPGPLTQNLDDTELTMEIQRGGARPVVTVSGELDLAGRDLLDALLTHVRSTDPGTVALDLGRVTFADTHGLSPALERDVVLVAASPAVARLLRLLGLRAPRPQPFHGETARPGRRRRHRGGRPAVG